MPPSTSQTSNSTQDILPLGADFKPGSQDTWLKLAEKVLKDREFEDLTSWTTEGFEVRPLYSRGDLPQEKDPSGFPGLYPFTRGPEAASPERAGGKAGWDVRMTYRQPDPELVNAEMLADIALGASSVVLRLDEAGRRGQDPQAGLEEAAGAGGTMVYSRADLARALENVPVDKVAIGLDAGAQVLPAAALLMAHWKENWAMPEAVRGAFNADPLGTLARTGQLNLATHEDGPLDWQLLAFDTARRYPGVTSLLVDTRPYHDAGCGEVQELAFMLATGVYYLRGLAAGLGIDEALSQMAFTLTADADFFLTIAKLRAARRLWARAAEASGASPKAQALKLHVQTSERMLTRNDPHVNMLRLTCAAFAAGVGGADAITVLPFTDSLGHPDEFSRRLAINTQNILVEESSIARVLDPAGGAYAIEALSERLATQAWTLFQSIEAGGGMGEALLDGRIQDMIGETWSERLSRLALRQERIVGVSAYPNLAERKIDLPEPDMAFLRNEALERVTAARRNDAAKLKCRAVMAADQDSYVEGMLNAALAGATIGLMANILPSESVTCEPLEAHRLAERFEALREHAAAFEAHTGKAPAVFVAAFGREADFSQRAGFARNFFAAGGIQGTGPKSVASPAEAAKAFEQSGAHLAVLCAGNEAYDAQGIEFIRILKISGARKVYVCGLPESLSELEQAGADAFLHDACDVLGILEEAYGVLGIKTG